MVLGFFVATNYILYLSSDLTKDLRKYGFSIMRACYYIILYYKLDMVHLTKQERKQFTKKAV